MNIETKIWDVLQPFSSGRDLSTRAVALKANITVKQAAAGLRRLYEKDLIFKWYVNGYISWLRN